MIVLRCTYELSWSWHLKLKTSMSEQSDVLRTDFWTWLSPWYWHRTSELGYHVHFQLCFEFDLMGGAPWLNNRFVTIKWTGKWGWAVFGFFHQKIFYCTEDEDLGPITKVPKKCITGKDFWSFKSRTPARWPSWRSEDLAYERCHEFAHTKGWLNLYVAQNVP